MDKSQIRFFEKAASEGFKGLEIKRHDGWELRFSEGYTRRVNSVSVYEVKAGKPLYLCTASEVFV